MCLRDNSVPVFTAGPHPPTLGDLLRHLLRIPWLSLQPNQRPVDGLGLVRPLAAVLKPIYKNHV